jgi:hypothetical protein
MALKRLDEEFELKAGTQLLPYMKRLLPSLEGRFQDLESTAKSLEGFLGDIRAVALMRMNEILIPATADIIAVTKLGFLLAPIEGLVTLAPGDMSFQIEMGAQQVTFTPSPYLIIEHSPDDYAIARLISYEQKLGILAVTITALHGNAGPWDDWMVSSTPGMADSTKLYHDEVGPWRDEVAANTSEVRVLHQEILDAAQALEDAGLDLYAYIRRDGTTDFTGPQKALAPPTNSNDLTLPTTAWTRARIIEYTGASVKRAGDSMTGALTLSGPPAAPLHAASKAYVDSILGGAGGIVTIKTVNPTLQLQSTDTAQHRAIEALGPQGLRKWALDLADASAESGGDAGSNFILLRYADSGVLLDAPLTIARASGAMAVKALTYNGAFSGTGDANLIGDISIYRVANPSTGALFLNQAKSAYHQFDGSNHSLAGGGLNVSGNINGQHISSYSLNTNGYPATVGDLTSHGNVSVDGTITTQGLTLVGAGSNQIQLTDQDWGPMYIHHNNDLIGFLSNGGGWVMYTTNAGHVWTPQYGWIHDYVNNTASNYAWDAANYRYNQVVSTVRWVYVGDIGIGASPNITEPYGGSAVTGWASSRGGYLDAFRFRQFQIMIGGGWYASGYA